MAFASVPEVLEELKRGRPIVLVDDPDRENEGDLCFAAEFASPELIALMMRECCGLICLALDAGAVKTREQLMREVWDEHWWGSTKTLDVHVASLRRKLTPEVIETVRSVGYRFAADDELPSARGE